MKILIIHGSPHNGNTLKLINKFKEELSNKGDVNYEFLNLRELNIQPCRGCFNCISKGEKNCPLKDDDIKTILKGIEKADGVIIAAPTYMYSIPALMKNLIDRLAYLGHRPTYFGKYAVVISTTYEVGLKEALKYLSLGTAWAWGFQLIGSIGAETHPFYLDQKRCDKVKNKIKMVAEKFYKAIKKNEFINVNFEEMMRFRALLKHSIYSKELFPADYEFYKKCNEENNGYFCKNYRINLLYNLASKALSSIVGNSMNKCRNRVDMNKKFLD